MIVTSRADGLPVRNCVLPTVVHRRSSRGLFEALSHSNSMSERRHVLLLLHAKMSTTESRSQCTEAPALDR